MFLLIIMQSKTKKIYKSADIDKINIYYIIYIKQICPYEF